jgi:hypothetical protein
MFFGHFPPLFCLFHDDAAETSLGNGYHIISAFAFGNSEWHKHTIYMPHRRVDDLAPFSLHV